MKMPVPGNFNKKYLGVTKVMISNKKYVFSSYQMSFWGE